MSVTVHHGDCLDVLRGMAEASVDSVVTDPPYGLEFMSVGWDTFATPKGGARSDADFSDYGSKEHPRDARGQARVMRNKSRAFGQWCEAWAREVYRVMKPGAHLVAFGGTRTYHRMVCAIEDAGFEVRDQLAWVYGTGFPKSLDVGKAIDKAAGAERETVGVNHNGACSPGYEAKDRGAIKPAGNLSATFAITAPATDAARQWQGWGTALKPAHEPIVLARKPLADPPTATVELTPEVLATWEAKRCDRV